MGKASASHSSRELRGARQKLLLRLWLKLPLAQNNLQMTEGRLRVTHSGPPHNPDLLLIYSAVHWTKCNTIPGHSLTALHHPVRASRVNVFHITFYSISCSLAGFIAWQLWCACDSLHFQVPTCSHRPWHFCPWVSLPLLGQWWRLHNNFSFSGTEAVP